MKRLLSLYAILATACALAAAEPHTIEELTMTRPASYPNWATNANYAGGPDIGTPTKVAPAAGRIADGWRNQDVPPAPQQNYEMDLINQWIQWIDAGFTASTASLAALTGIPDGGKILVRGNHGLYTRLAAGTPYGSDGYWLVTSADGGQFVHENYGGATSQKTPYIGPAPGETTTIATPAGKINPQFESFALIERNDQGPGVAFTMTRPFADPTTLSDEGPATTLSTVPRVGDVVRVNAGVGVTCADVFRIAALISQDSSATYTLVTPRVTATLPVTWANATGQYVYVGLSFDYVVAASPAPTGIRISFRMQSNGAVSATARFNAYITELLRP